ncbi:SAE2-domain-containing protein [Byssothecium circinans]|uniref:SAE2-domain-containing protein n=1 Tax=Byssothecium circinans TaxID=147558 RepID=A0A6A5U906_9PLEO|nr:SAE2-domain-containing protein [Byssothecium circinans]
MGELSAWVEKNRELWTHFYDEVIIPDLEKEWKRRTEEHEKELKSKDEEHQILLAHVNNEIIATARLREENARLRRLIQKQGSTPLSSTEQLETSTIDATVSAAEYRHITDKFNELNKRYQNDAQKMKYLERKNFTVMQKNKEMKESVLAWQEYCDRNIDKQKLKTVAKSARGQREASKPIEGHDAKPNVPSSPGLLGMTTPKSFVGQERSSPAPIMPLAQCAHPPQHPDQTEPEVETAGREQTDAASERAEQEDLPEEHTPTNARSVIAAGEVAVSGQPNSEKLTSSQTTVDDIAEQDGKPTQTADDDDMPQFVSERSLKRKRKPSAGLKVYTDRSDGTPAKPIRVKEEQYSSPPPLSAALELQRTDTMDLDEVGTIVRTPHRRRLQRTLSIHSNLTGTLRNQRSNSAPFGGNSMKAEPNEESEILFSDPAAEEEVEVGDPRAISMPVSANVLQPLDPNVVVNEGTPNKCLKKAALRELEKHDFIMESGETPPMDENRMRAPPSVARARYNEKMRALKSTHTPSKTSVSTPKTAPAKVRAAQMPTSSSSANRQTLLTPSIRALQRPEPRTEPVADRRPIWTMGPPSASRKAAASPPPPKEKVPLRSKPMNELCIQDFRPNPAFNQGYTHAFSETVRKQSDRLCLPGCTDPKCCGSTFRALALAAAPLSSDQEDELLQDYLGNAYDSFGLTQMSQEERKEVVLQARTRQMAKQFGKHRQAYQRGRSPPGFWRMEFPSTQDLEADKAKAKEMQKEIVKERWLEANRQGGRWIFKDE